MDRRLATSGLLLCSATLAFAPLGTRADHAHDKDDDNDDRSPRLSVTVSFGVGLNTAQPGNAANHHILPSVIRVKKGGVVNFVVAGFHWIRIYNPGVTPEAIALPPASSLFINDNNNLYYNGIAPAGGPPPGRPATAEPANGSNRVESVSFAAAGDYLVICNVRPHFLDGMHAIIRVR